MAEFINNIESRRHSPFGLNLQPLSYFGSSNPDWSRTLAILTLLNSISKTRLSFVWLSKPLSLHMIRRERNRRNQNQAFNTTNTLVKMIDKAIKDRITSLHLPTTSKLGGSLDGVNYDVAKSGYSEALFSTL